MKKLGYCIWGFIMALVLAVSLLPAQALAAGKVTITTEADLETALKDTASQTIILGVDMTLSSLVRVGADVL